MSLPTPQKPAWYEHTLRNERGEVVNTIIADYEEGPAFGKPDVDYDKLFTVVVVPLYYPGEVERLRAELGEAKGEYDRSANKVAALTDQLAAFESLHGGELGLPKEGWPEYHKRKMESLRDLATGQRDTLLRKIQETLQREYWDDYAGLDETRELISAALSASAEPGSPVSPYPNRLCHIDYTAHPYRCGCLRGDEEAQKIYDDHCRASAPAESKVTPVALREAMENLAVRASVDRPVPVYMSAPAQIGPLVILGKVCLRVHYKGLKWYHEQLIDDCWEPLAVEEFDALLAEALSKA